MTSKNNAYKSSDDTPTTPFAAPISSIENLIEAQTTFIKMWLHQHAKSLSLQMWHWLGAQPISRYISVEDLQRLMNEGLLSQPMSAAIRADIRDILHTLIYHPVNDTIPLSDLVDDTQVATLANYIGSHEQQRNIWIHGLIGNETFADLLTQTLYHAINDFMESTLDKAGGVGKLMKMGRSSFERATNRNLDEKLQNYLHRNIKDLARRAETNAQAHLSNDEVTRLMIAGWTRIKDQPMSHIQSYLRDDDEHNSIQHIEGSIQQSYNRLRLSPYWHTLVTASVDTWYANHQHDSFAKLAAGLNSDSSAMAQFSDTLLPIIDDAIESPWFGAHIHELLQAFFAQDGITQALKAGLDVNHPSN